MIARVWKGKTKKIDFDEYTQFLKDRAIPDYKSINGIRGLTFLNRVVEEIGYFELITYWDHIDQIKAFAGEKYEVAKYYPEDKKYLLEFEEHVIHYDVFAEEINR